MAYRKRTVIGTLAAAILLLAGCGSRGDLTFTLVFRNSDNLQPGQYMTYHGIRIGEVRSVDLMPDGTVHVRMRVRSGHREQVYREARFAIRRAGGLVDLSGERMVAMEDRGSTRTPVESDDVLQGYDGWWRSLTDRASDVGGYISTARGWADDLVSMYRNSPEAQAFSESMRDFAASAGTMAIDQFSEFRRDKLPDIERQATALKERLERDGLSAEAERFWHQFQEWRNGVRKVTPESDEPDE